MKFRLLLEIGNIQIILLHVNTLCGQSDRLLSLAYLLFEVASLLLVDQHQVQVVAHGELLVDVSHGGSQIVTSQK